MARLMLSKATLSKERKQLAAFQQFLPALDLKRQQIRQACKSFQRELSALEFELLEVEKHVGEQLPMMAACQLSLNNLIQLSSITVGQRNHSGCVIPTLDHIEFQQAQLPALAQPHWLPVLQDKLTAAATLHAKLMVKRRQVDLMASALVKITQRVNLFENVLIPTARQNIKRIQVYLGDREREAVVASKLAKRQNRISSGV